MVQEFVSTYTEKMVAKRVFLIDKIPLKTLPD